MNHLRRIADYALIGNCETAALIHRAARIEWLCWPRFDSQACLASLLGSCDNGFWDMRPLAPGAKFERRYRGDSLILETHIETVRASAVIIDFMPVGGGPSAVVRLVEGRRGVLRFTSDLRIRFEYGRIPGRWRADSEHAVRAVAGPHAVRLRADLPLKFRDDGRCSAEFSIRAGEQVGFVLSYFESYGREPAQVNAASALQRTERFWRTWIRRCHYEGPWSGAVRRSLLTIKALAYGPSGGIAAAPTSSLPETLAGSKNWDYRFCWIRDSTFTLLSFLYSGYRSEAVAWRDWLLRAIGGEPIRVRPLYGLGGEAHVPEWEPRWLTGFGGARPVRFGNAASDQLQLDVYGEVIDALEQAHRHGIELDEAAWRLQMSMLEHLERCWRRPDSGIWEERATPKRFTHSRVMIWTAFERMIHRATAERRRAPLAHWRRFRDRVHAEVCRRGFDRKLNSFVRDFDSSDLDASLLLLPQVGFLPPEDPRIRGTIDAVGTHLARDGLIYRYNTGAGKHRLPLDEPALLVCSLWYADALLLTGRRDQAIQTFERVLALRNDVGLLAEAFDRRVGQLSGNFPQALSHLAIVNTVLNLRGEDGPAWRRGARPTPRGAGLRKGRSTKERAGAHAAPHR